MHFYILLYTKTYMKSLIPFANLPVNLLVGIGAVVIVVVMVVVVASAAVRNGGFDLTPCLLSYVAHTITEIAFPLSLVQ